MQPIATLIPRPRERTALSPFLMGDRVHSIATIGNDPFDGEIVGVRGEFWIVVDEEGKGWRRLPCELSLIASAI